MKPVTDQELSLKIALHIEPKPEPVTLTWREDETPPEQPTYKCWRPDWPCSQMTGGFLFWTSGNWTPLSINDPAMTLLLLEKLAKWDEVCIEEFNGWHVEWCWGPNDGSEHIRVVAATLGRAVAEAFAKAEGLI